MNSEQELRPCLCGSADIELLKAVDDDTYPFCKSCGLTGELCIDKETAILRWNTRPIEDRQTAQIEALKELVRAITYQADFAAQSARFALSSSWENEQYRSISQTTETARDKCRELGLEV